MELNYFEFLIGSLIAICIIFYLSTIESLEKNHITAITCIGWAIYILFAKGGLQWHLPQ